MVTVVDKLLFTAVMVLFALFGVGIIRFGRMVSATARAMAAEERTPAGDLEPGGTAEVHGTVEAAPEGTVESPLYGREVVEAVTKVQRRTSGGDAAPGWRTRHEEHVRAPFVVADDSGAVRVEPPADARPTVPMEWTRFGAGADEAPERVRTYLESIDGADPDAGLDAGPVSLGNRQRCGEGSLQPGDDVVVYGQAVEATADPDGPDVAITDDGSRFVYSTLDEAELASSTSKLVLMIYGFGALWIVFTLFGGLVPWLVG